ncbi:GntR family transcriptional regulator [Pectobacterium aroidearum]|jgi:DNA-binding GntR family transcriptional regulator|uniref:GntR family transcriptional regulator n=2 Tax=Pectobacterium TaxID=122277 RepID=A0AAW3SZN5_9GAMM|nr:MULTISPECIES: GntR family transcriptional regulator [Pectobacterium]UKE85783.1 GntR family transcriptional regulator [Pectobacterium sp. PL152]ACT11860.1 transcriptional regulator, GntR family [Pectobacterium carotovorum subsp. carotovorum PC1]MBA0204845.1 GntR family transcriptional regulator [Pectobacterium aroidearum]MBA5200309.1 GntR family transcriptional regulator [Pectobacterium aroidearum]MBA5206099.1 GntR family transcriptional regulator [Pectobacterium aroidearum]
MDTSFQINNNEPVNQQIYRVLRKDIVECNIPPGKLLSEKEISVRFDVSRQPVREAFIKLAEAGLVQILPQRGTFVMKISEQRVADARFIRQALECAIVRRAAEMVTDEQLLTLEHNLRRQELAAQNEQVREFLSLDDSFHQLLTQIANCPLAWETIESIKATMDRVRFLSLSQVSPPVSLIQQHYLIFSALKARDPDAAEKAIREHLQEMIYSITPIAQQNSDWFEHA